MVDTEQLLVDGPRSPTARQFEFNDAVALLRVILRREVPCHFPARVHPGGACLWWACIGHDLDMGSADDKPRKTRHPLAKVPRYEEPNSLPLPGIGGGSSFGLRYGRFGHGSDGKEQHRPAWLGRFFLRLLGMRSKVAQEPITREHEPQLHSEEGTLPHPSS